MVRDERAEEALIFPFVAVCKQGVLFSVITMHLDFPYIFIFLAYYFLAFTDKEFEMADGTAKDKV